MHLVLLLYSQKPELTELVIAGKYLHYFIPIKVLTLLLFGFVAV